MEMEHNTYTQYMPYARMHVFRETYVRACVLVYFFSLSHCVCACVCVVYCMGFLFGSGCLSLRVRVAHRTLYVCIVSMDRKILCSATLFVWHNIHISSNVNEIFSQVNHTKRNPTHTQHTYIIIIVSTIRFFFLSSKHFEITNFKAPTIERRENERERESKKKENQIGYTC